ncbi:TetR family transcriptional regulator [Galbitalea sp. SE-J8]|uniref:TetR/AcrR family transcriptional regulator n=1 Tax=Galbitalea sp. SE-J8 TaxID=3054952 RepID=UPI00259CFF1B|nr:TetR family transcriptional regulator [Galbitalea sp. SE-J8]MDM4763418.1 TetR family transcriptional regulator [Galbitalea sp. SE-J8]
MSSLDRRSELIDAAFRVVSRDGMGAATTRAIVAEAGMPLASFHYAFASRDELLRELVEHVLDAESLAAASTLRLGSDIRASIVAALTAYVDELAADPSRELAMFELTQYALRTPALRHLAAEQYARYRATVAGVLEAGAAHARVRWTLPLDDVARLVVAFTDGITFAWLADRDRDGALRIVAFAADSLSTLTAPAPGPATPTEEPA